MRNYVIGARGEMTCSYCDKKFGYRDGKCGKLFAFELSHFYHSTIYRKCIVPIVGPNHHHRYELALEHRTTPYGKCQIPVMQWLDCDGNDEDCKSLTPTLERLKKTNTHKNVLQTTTRKMRGNLHAPGVLETMVCYLNIILKNFDSLIYILISFN